MTTDKTPSAEERATWRAMEHEFACHSRRGEPCGCARNAVIHLLDALDAAERTIENVRYNARQISGEVSEADDRIAALEAEMATAKAESDRRTLAAAHRWNAVINEMTKARDAALCEAANFAAAAMDAEGVRQDVADGLRADLARVTAERDVAIKAADDAFADAERRRRDRAKVLDVKTTEGLTASEWLMRTADAEAKRDEAIAERDTRERERDALREVLWLASMRVLSVFADAINNPGHYQLEGRHPGTYAEDGHPREILVEVKKILDAARTEAGL